MSLSRTVSKHQGGIQSGCSAPLPATAAETRQFLIERSRRSFTPIGKAFIQNPDNTAAIRSAPLADFVRRGDKRGLIALLLHTIISSGGADDDDWSYSLHLQVWARALDTVATADGPSATSAATKILSRLVDRQLIEWHRTGRERKVTVTLLSADGTGRPYARPKGGSSGDRFVRLSHRFWIDRWDQRLTLPAIAMLLLALHEKPGFTLPTEKVPDWYGWSADTAERGLSELEDHGLVRISNEAYTNPLSPTGLSSRNVYTVLPPFDAASVERAAKVRR